VAPHTGHVSNLCQPVGAMIEPVDAECFQRDPCQWIPADFGSRLPAAEQADIPNLRDYTASAAQVDREARVNLR
jgi:hypothetical protein